MTEIRRTDSPEELDGAAIRLRALEIVAEFWRGNLSTTEALDAAKGYAEWIENGEADAALARQIEETMEVATELAEARTTADEMTRAVKRLVVERDYAIAEAAELATTLEDVRAEARGARSDYEELKGFNADLADKRDRLRQLLNQTRAALHVALHHATCTDPSEARPAELSGCRFALQEATDFLDESA